MTYLFRIERSGKRSLIVVKEVVIEDFREVVILFKCPCQPVVIFESISEVLEPHLT